jgi:23S rRNA pseudouridine955/2504/2580 synthase/23S rRNA pseudouridine1911/1915/1917 synthase
MTLLAFLRSHCSQAPSVKAIKRAIDGKYCTVNGQIETFSSHPLHKGDKVSLDLAGLISQAISAPSILFEDDSLLICNKPMGMVCENKVINSIWPRFRGKLCLVHRLDKETTGVLIIGKTDAFVEKMIPLFRAQEVHKRYLALVDGTVKGKKGKIENELGKKGAYHGQTIYGSVVSGRGARAITLWTCLKATPTASLLLAEPLTGRTHQLRVHFSQMGHPILGDSQYGKAFKCPLHPKRYLLHAYSIRFSHPTDNREIEVVAPIPLDFQQAFAQLHMELPSKNT